MHDQLGQGVSNDIRKKIEEYSYGLNDLIKRGDISSVFRGLNQKTRQSVAIKVFNRREAENKKRTYMMENYIAGRIQFSNSPNIVRCIQILSTTNNCYVILQFCNEGDLQNMLNKRLKLSQSQAIPIFRDLVSGFKSLVQCKYVHRNLRPSNILFKDRIAKISDLNCMKKQSQNFYDKQEFNTPDYLSYQALTQNIYSPKNDIWSIGVILFEILHGKMPWPLKNSIKQNHIQQLKATDIGAKIQRTLSQDLIDFIRKCLKINQKQRLGVIQFFNHPFILRIFDGHIPELPQKNKSNEGPDRYFKSNKDIQPVYQQGQEHHKNKYKNLGQKQFITQINYMRFIFRLLQILPTIEQTANRTTLGLRFLATKQMLSLVSNAEKALIEGQNKFNAKGWRQFMQEKQKIKVMLVHINDYKMRYQKNRKQFQSLITLLSNDKSLKCVADDNLSRSQLLSILSVKYSLEQCRAVWWDICKKKEQLSQQQYQKYFNKQAFKLDYLITFYQLNCLLIDNFSDPQYFLRNSKMDTIIDIKPSILEPSVKIQFQNKLKALSIIQ